MNLSSMAMATAAVVVGMGVAGEAKSDTAELVHYQNAAGFCQPALPVFEGNIRKRPTAVANEGTSNSFVSCSLASIPDEDVGIESVNLVLYNRTASAIDVTCSLVHSFTAGGTIVPLTESVPAGNRTFYTWLGEDVGAEESLDFLNFSCNLPPGVEIGYGFYFYNYEIGT